jgi:hypothetical protein
MVLNLMALMLGRLQVVQVLERLHEQSPKMSSYPAYNPTESSLCRTVLLIFKAARVSSLSLAYLVPVSQRMYVAF